MIIRMNQNIEILERTVQLLGALADDWAEREKKTVVHRPCEILSIFHWGC